jgi:hypothetical protein
MFVHLGVTFALVCARRARDAACLESSHEHLLIATGTPRGQASRRQTQVRTVEVQPDALPKLRNHLFCDAGVRADRACLRTGVTFLQALDQDVVGLPLHVRMSRDNLRSMHGWSPQSTGLTLA